MTGGGHLGIMKTLGKIQTKYYWPQMTMSMKKFVKRCRACQEVNKKFRKANSILHPIPHEVDQFWHFICIDCITNLPTSMSGCMHILTVTCKFTKFVCAKALPDIRAYELLRLLQFCTTGFVLLDGSLYYWVTRGENLAIRSLIAWSVWQIAAPRLPVIPKQMVSRKGGTKPLRQCFWNWWMTIIWKDIGINSSQVVFTATTQPSMRLRESRHSKQFSAIKVNIIQCCLYE